MSRNINLRNHIHTIFHAQTLQVGEFFLGIRTILGGQPRKTFTLQAESSVGLVPVVIKELYKTIVIEMNLEFIQFIER